MPRAAVLLVTMVLALASYSTGSEASTQATASRDRALCAAATRAAPSCAAHVLATPTGTMPPGSPTPVGLTPLQLHTAYAVPATATVPITIAIVVGFDNPRVKADLDVYNAAFGLPAFPSCSSTVATACFEKVQQKGKVQTNESWALEASLDVQTAHQMCQNCKILLVEGLTNAWSSLMWGLDTAVARGAKVVNSSFAGPESSSLLPYDSHYNHPGVAFTAATGDWGYGVNYPASSRYVTAVGGTTLNLNVDGSWASETVWAGAGSGCSAYSPKPAFQTDACPRRTVADVSAAADPATGAAVYDSFGIQGQSGWFRIGGTSLAAPLLAAIYAHAGITSGQQNAVPYARHTTENMHDVTSGSTAACGSYLCQGQAGYDGPTGLGSPNGPAAF
jgi:subtilase family serine protease